MTRKGKTMNKAPANATTTDGPDVEALAAKIAELEKALAERPVIEKGHRAYATKDVPRAMIQFAKWIAREFPELKVELDENGRASDATERLVTIASKAYKAFQASDLNV